MATAACTETTEATGCTDAFHRYPQLGHGPRPERQGRALRARLKSVPGRKRRNRPIGQYK